MMGAIILGARPCESARIAPLLCVYMAIRRLDDRTPGRSDIQASERTDGRLITVVDID